MLFGFVDWLGLGCLWVIVECPLVAPGSIFTQTPTVNLNIITSKAMSRRRRNAFIGSGVSSSILKSSGCCHRHLSSAYHGKYLANPQNHKIATQWPQLRWLTLRMSTFVVDCSFIFSSWKGRFGESTRRYVWKYSEIKVEKEHQNYEISCNWV